MSSVGLKILSFAGRTLSPTRLILTALLTRFSLFLYAAYKASIHTIQPRLFNPQDFYLPLRLQPILLRVPFPATLTHASEGQPWGMFTI